jgi:hypothetical protein
MITIYLRDNIAGFRNEAIVKCSVHKTQSGGVDLDSMHTALLLALKEIKCECSDKAGIE